MPDVLLSGDHAKIARWRREQSLLRTLERRPDLLEKWASIGLSTILVGLEGFRESDLAGSRVTERWRAFMRFQIDRTRGLYADAWPGIRLLEREGQLSIGAAASLYSGILDVIETNDYDVFTRRASLGTWAKLSRFPALLWRLRTS